MEDSLFDEELQLTLVFRLVFTPGRLEVHLQAQEMVVGAPPVFSVEHSHAFM
jgi:hypothetical protein